MPELLADVPDHRVDRIDLRDDPASSGAKLVVVSSRSVNSLLWSLLFVGIFGPGEALAEAGRGPIEALEAVGAPPLFVTVSVYAAPVWPWTKLPVCDLEIVRSGASTLTAAVAVLPVPPSLEVTGSVVLT